MRLDIEQALVEVQEKSASQIEVETAYKWASRAVACYICYQKTRQLSWLLRAEDMRHESMEHAALAQDDGVTLRAVSRAMESYRRP